MRTFASCRLGLLSMFFNVFPRHASCHYRVPVNEKGLREIRLDPNNLKPGREQHGINVKECMYTPDGECHDNQHYYH